MIGAGDIRGRFPGPVTLTRMPLSPSLEALMPTGARRNMLANPTEMSTTSVEVFQPEGENTDISLIHSFQLIKPFAEPPGAEKGSS